MTGREVIDPLNRVVTVIQVADGIATVRLAGPYGKREQRKMDIKPSTSNPKYKIECRKCKGTYDALAATDLCGACGSRRIKVTEYSYGLRYLRSLPKGTTLWTVVRHVSRSGMRRVIDVRVFDGNEMFCVRVAECNAFVKTAERASKVGGDYVVDGCGMDMGFHLVDTLARIAYPNDPRAFERFTHRWI